MESITQNAEKKQEIFTARSKHKGPRCWNIPKDRWHRLYLSEISHIQGVAYALEQALRRHVRIAQAKIAQTAYGTPKCAYRAGIKVDKGPITAEVRTFQYASCTASCVRKKHIHVTPDPCIVCSSGLDSAKKLNQPKRKAGTSESVTRLRSSVRSGSSTSNMFRPPVIRDSTMKNSSNTPWLKRLHAKDLFTPTKSKASARRSIL